MSKSSRFAVAVHILTLLAREGDSFVSSESIAHSVNTNAVIIRRILGRLRKAGLVRVQEGSSGGSTLARDAQQISLLDVHRAVEDADLFALHPNRPNQNCTVGRGIIGALETVMDDAQARMERAFAEVSIADMLATVGAQADEA